MSKLYDKKQHRARLKNWDKIIEVNKENIKLDLQRKTASAKNANFNNTREDEEYIIRADFIKEGKINEDATFVPRFNIKKYDHQIFNKFPPNKELKYDKDLMTLAIEYGMILQIQYRGAEDTFVQGHQRVIYPMVVGTSQKGKPLLRAFHLRGWSVSKNTNIQKDWRLFRTDRILSMSFTGSFFRMPPAGYNMNDKGMRGGIIKAADFNEIRKNQKNLFQKNVIQNKKDVVMDEKQGKVTVINVLPTNTNLDLLNPWDNPHLNEKDKSVIRITFLKSTVGNKYIAVLGALGKRGNTVKVTSQGKYLGVYKVVRSTMGQNLGKPHIKKVSGVSSYPLYVFVKKQS